MKKGKVIGKGQIAVGVMVIALAAAIWLNSKYLPSSTKYLGEAALVNGSTSEAAQTSASSKTEATDYFKSVQKERKTARENAIKTVEELLDNKNLTEADKKSALEKIEKIGADALTESNIETLLKAKGFENCLAVINNNGINIIVKSEGLTSAQTLQIQDIITNETDISLENIKIIPVAK